MGAWNSVYNTQPPDANNPGYGAAAIRDLKVNLESIFGYEHDFPVDAPLGTQGGHLQGTAIVEYTNDITQTKKNNNQIGRLKCSTDGDDKTTLQINTASGYINVEGYNQMTLIGDQDITGLKNFATAPTIPSIDYESAPAETIANKFYVDQETEPVNINPTTLTVGPAAIFNIIDYEGTTVDSIPQGTNTDNLEALLTQVSSELQLVRNSVSAVALNNPNGQLLKVTDSPTFAGLTVNGTINATEVHGAVWGA